GAAGFSNRSAIISSLRLYRYEAFSPGPESSGILAAIDSTEARSMWHGSTQRLLRGHESDVRQDLQTGCIGVWQAKLHSAKLPRPVVRFAQSRVDWLWRLVRIGATASVLIAILGATLSPFDWVPPRAINGASYRATGGLEFRDMGIAYTETPPP